MERVLLNKVTYLVERLGWTVTVVTTDQKGREPFYAFPGGVKIVDLGINYTDDNNKNPIGKILGYLKRRRLHKKRLTELLMQEKADIVVSLFPSESSFLPQINDGSKKVLELHFNKFFRLQYNRSGLLGLIDSWRTREDEKLVRKFDKFVVLSNEDRGYWGDLSNIEVIPNAALFDGEDYSSTESHRVIAVGRLDYQKGFDRLVKAWDIVQRDEQLKSWRLDIFGQGEWQDMLQRMIDELGLQDSIKLNAPTKNIGQEYASSSMLVMSSNYEGFPMVMIEAMAKGLPVVSFDFKCGPKDIISHGENGLIVKNGDIEALAQAMKKMMLNNEERRQMGERARKVVNEYSEEVVMRKWITLFDSLVDAK
ncbi:MAG: glycosyltransferase family 4 protein [Alistipes sp.]|nr:glycosyltransferase family 4 protein [Alistipes sp.]